MPVNIMYVRWRTLSRPVPVVIKAYNDACVRWQTRRMIAEMREFDTFNVMLRRNRDHAHLASLNPGGGQA
jgi:hypothetical protein